MASAAPSLATDVHQGVKVNQQSVSATGVEVSATNGFVFVTFADETQLAAFASGLDAQGTAYTISGPSIRFTAHNRH